MRKVIINSSLIISLSFFLTLTKVCAQSVPVTSIFDDYYRQMQLLGKVDSNFSFCVRPALSKDVLKVNDVFDPYSTLRKNRENTGADGRGVFLLLPLTWQQQVNSNQPYGWNDGAMIPARGYQTIISGGVYLKYGFLDIQLRPEYVYAVNPAFNGFASGHGSQDLINYYDFYRLIDLPERFGNGPYSKAFWGQSSIRATFGAVSLGLSTENLWWGPGITNSLLMSSNAPGFKHVTFNTIKPVNTVIGGFEWQVFAGRLDQSNYPLLQTGSTSVDSARRKGWRYLTGFNINYHPRFIPGLTIGLNRTFNAYKEDVKSIADYIPFLLSYQKKNENNGAGDAIPRDQLTSAYVRWYFAKAEAELYFEYGREDNSYNLNDFWGDPDHSRAYTVGFRKMLDLNSHRDQHILLSSEITQLALTTDDRLVRYDGSWYVHSTVKQGYTNLGQVLGAGIGPGGNLQSADISWICGLKKIGVSFQRYEHDTDFINYYYSPINGNSRNWVDLAFGVQGTWDFRNFLFNIKLQQIKSLNYEWVLKDYIPDQYYIPHNTVYNFHGELGITYRF